MAGPPPAPRSGRAPDNTLFGIGATARAGSRDDAHAVVIGINRYLDDSIPDLNFARADAEAVYEVLTDPVLGHFNKANVQLLVDQDATERRIKGAIGTQLPKRAAEGHTVCVYFAGHGAPDIDPRSGSADGLEKYLVPHDADINDLRSTAISMETIQRWFGWIGASQVVFFIDSCYSGGAGGRSFDIPGFQRRSLLTDEYLDRLAQGEGRYVVTACATNEVSLETPDLGHGLFTYRLVEGLKGAAADDDGLVKLDGLYEYLYRTVSDDARKLGGSMSPVRKGAARGIVYLARYETAKQRRAREALREGWDALERGDLDRAEAAWLEVLAIEPDNAGARDGMHEVQERRAREAEARAAEEQKKRERLERRRRALLGHRNKGALTLTEFAQALELLEKDATGVSRAEADMRDAAEHLADGEITAVQYLRVVSALAAPVVAEPAAPEEVSETPAGVPGKKDPPVTERTEPARPRDPAPARRRPPRQKASNATPQVKPEQTQERKEASSAAPTRLVHPLLLPAIVAAAEASAWIGISVARTVLGDSGAAAYRDDAIVSLMGGSAIFGFGSTAALVAAFGFARRGAFRAATLLGFVAAMVMLMLTTDFPLYLGFALPLVWGMYAVMVVSALGVVAWRSRGAQSQQRQFLWAIATGALCGMVGWFLAASTHIGGLTGSPWWRTVSDGLAVAGMIGVLACLRTAEREPVIGRKPERDKSQEMRQRLGLDTAQPPWPFHRYVLVGGAMLLLMRIGVAGGLVAAPEEVSDTTSVAPPAGPSFPSIYDAAQVTTAAVASQWNPTPDYPSSLRSQRLEGSVAASFVVDTMGLADSSSLVIGSSDHDEFTNAVRAVVPRLRFTPATLQGARVFQRTQQTFVFTPPSLGPFASSEVSTPAERRPGHLYLNSPRTPDGHLTAEFIIDTLGRIEPASVIIRTSLAPSLADSARNVLATARFSPAIIDGMRVRQYSTLQWDFRPDSASPEQVATSKGRDERRLLGGHTMDIQWTGQGVATVENSADGLKLWGRIRAEKDSLVLSGSVTIVDENTFTMTGQILTTYQTRPCVRRGTFTFQIRGQRRYWRMQQITNPCEQHVDYIDIYY